MVSFAWLVRVIPHFSQMFSCTAGVWVVFSKMHVTAGRHCAPQRNAPAINLDDRLMHREVPRIRSRAFLPWAAEFDSVVIESRVMVGIKNVQKIGVESRSTQCGLRLFVASAKRPIPTRGYIRFHVAVSECKIE